MGILQGVREPTRAKPIVIYDGECAFCMRQVDRLRSSVGDAVECVAYQDAVARFPSVLPTAFQRSVHLIDTDGRVYDGAEAAFRALAAGPRASRWLWCYLHIPGFATISESAYRWVAQHRGKLPTW